MSILETVHTRTCGSCSLCCKLLAIEELNKPRNQWCKLCDAGRGCRTYDSRPHECREFNCGFLTLPQLGSAWYPQAAKLIVCPEPGGHTIFVHVEPSRPDAWRREPFFSKIKLWAREAANSQGQVIVCVGQKKIVVLPDSEVDLGIVEDDEIVVTEQSLNAGSIQLRPFKMKRDDPRANRLVSPSSRRAMALA